MSEQFDPSTFVTVSPDVADLNGAALLKLAAALQTLEQWCVARACAKTADEFLSLEDDTQARRGIEGFIRARLIALPRQWQDAAYEGKFPGEVVGSFEAVANGEGEL